MHWACVLRAPARRGQRLSRLQCYTELAILRTTIQALEVKHDPTFCHEGVETASFSEVFPRVLLSFTSTSYRRFRVVVRDDFRAHWRSTNRRHVHWYSNSSGLAWPKNPLRTPLRSKGQVCSQSLSLLLQPRIGTAGALSRA